MNLSISGPGGFVLFKKAQFIFALGAIFALPARSQEPHKFTAREIFYGDPAPAAKAQGQPIKPNPPKTVAHSSNNTQKPHRNTETTTAAVSSGTSERDRRDNNQAPAHAVLVNASTTSGAPLGIRVSVLKIADGQSREMDTDTAFRPGDRIRLNVEVSDAGYLYVLNRGSSGTWMPLFPSPEIPDASNRVQRGVKYQIPSAEHVFTIHEPAGTDKLFVIFSRKPQLDVEALTDDVSGRDKPPPRAPQLTATYALNLPPMTDASVDRLRTTYSRDLIIEKVDEDTGPQKEKALYAAIPSGGPDARVVLDVQIKHP